MADTTTTSAATPRGHRKEREGKVISNKMAKTIIVRVERRFPHPKFKKVVTGYKKFYAHDEKAEAKVGDRVRIEIERRIFNRYLRFCRLYWWYQGPNNWNGVCNSSVAATFLLLEPEPGRVARALELALDGLRVFLDTCLISMKRATSTR